MVERALNHSLVRCGSCGLVSSLVSVSQAHRSDCGRCGARLSARRPDSLSRTWALLLTAMILYVPANLLPILNVVSFGRAEADTIFSGVVALVQSGDLPIAAIVFLASIAIPAVKLMGLTFLLVSVQLKWRWRPRDRTKFYGIIEFIGRWSMIDIFVISMLVALIKLEQVATIEPGFAAVCFAGVVIITMLAAMSFDPRHIWDAIEE